MDSCKIFGLAVGVCYINKRNPDIQTLYPYKYGFPTEKKFDAFVYEGREGDTVVHLVKKQTVTIEKGQYPDKGLHITDTGGVKGGVYEFYFDEPVTVKGTFFVGLRHAERYDETLDDEDCTRILIIITHTKSGLTPYTRPGYEIIRTRNDTVVYWATYGKTSRPIDSLDAPTSIPDVEELELESDKFQCLFPIIWPRHGSVDEATGAMAVVELSPNPTRGRTTVHSESAIRSVEVCDMSGRVLQRKQVTGRWHQVELTDRLPRGCYVVRVVTEKGIAAKKLVVE